MNTKRIRSLRDRPPLLLGACLVASSVIASAARAEVVTIDPRDFASPLSFWDRWMYPFNGTNGSRGFAPTFAAFPDPVDGVEFDVKDGVFAIVADTGGAGIPTGEAPERYLVSSVVVTATHSVGTFEFDPSYDAWQTYLETDDPAYVADGDIGRPIELYGIGLRNGFTGISLVASEDGPPLFEEDEEFGSSDPSGRNLFPIGFDNPDSEGDVSNNVLPTGVGSGFDTTPWAIGRATVTPPGNTVIEGSPGTSVGETFEFEVDLSDPDVLAYVQEGLASGRLGFTLVSMHRVGMMQGGVNPNFYTSDNFDPVSIPPTITIDYVLAPEAPSAASALAALGAVALVRRRAPVRR